MRSQPEFSILHTDDPHRLSSVWPRSSILLLPNKHWNIHQVINIINARVCVYAYVCPCLCVMIHAGGEHFKRFSIFKSLCILLTKNKRLCKIANICAFKHPRIKTLNVSFTPLLTSWYISVSKRITNQYIQC